MKFQAVFCLVFLTFVFITENSKANGAPSAQSEDMLKTLLELDRMYSAVARPSVRSGPITEDVNSTNRKIQRAIGMLTLHHLEKLYADRSRPRFGKRTEQDSSIPEWPNNDYDNQVLKNQLINYLRK